MSWTGCSGDGKQCKCTERIQEDMREILAEVTKRRPFPNCTFDDLVSRFESVPKVGAIKVPRSLQKTYLTVRNIPLSGTALERENLLISNERMRNDWVLPEK